MASPHHEHNDSFRLHRAKPDGVVAVLNQDGFVMAEYNPFTGATAWLKSYRAQSGSRSSESCPNGFQCRRASSDAAKRDENGEAGAKRHSLGRAVDHMGIYMRSRALSSAAFRRSCGGTAEGGSIGEALSYAA
jgi:hypothetical protein